MSDSRPEQIEHGAASHCALAPDIVARVDGIARTAVLLVASDFDGTLAPIVDDPAKASPRREAVAALHMLATMAQTHVAVVSGRALRDLADRGGFSDQISLIGSHGSEFDPGFVETLPAEAIQRRDGLRDEVRKIAALGPGLAIEDKPAGLAFHYRKADEALAERAVRMLLDGPAKGPGVHLRHGKKVIELSVLPTDKGTALSTLRHRVGATAAIFLGDDVTDEDAFATLSGPDLGVKVGEGATRAEFRIGDPVEVAQLLARLAETRSRWLAGSDSVPIEEHVMLSDQRTIALATPDARVVWCCAPRIDSAAIFGELVGGESAGYFAIRDASGAPPLRQSYVGDSMLVKTEWKSFSVTDFLDCSGGRAFLRAGRTDLVRMIEGTGRVTIEFAPRPDFGRQPTRLRPAPDGLQVEGSLDPLALRSPGITWQIVEDGKHERAVAEIELGAAPLVLELRYGVSSAKEMPVTPARRAEQTQRFWEAWAEQLRVPPLHEGLLRRSALVIKALSYGPTGAICAAGTTSLPEELGGTRNWDYRYSWLRDAAIGARALARLGSTGVGTRFIEWLLGILDRDGAPESLRPLYSVTGEHLGAEADISELPGYCGSRPVRIGNAAAQQLQLDVFGPILDLVATLAQDGFALSAEHWRVAEEIVGAVAARWHEPDHGIWEIRGPRQHHVHSKVMCWLAVDRAISIADLFATETPPAWIELRDSIAHEVLLRGWDAKAGAFTATYGDGQIDAAALSVGLCGLLPGKDERFVSTVAAVERVLRDGPTVRRYLYDDGLPGREGGFHLCTAWLIEAMILVGRIDDAKELFEAFAKCFGPTGLAPEEYCPRTNRSLGNHPQVYSHAGLIGAAVAIAQAQRD